MDEAESKRQALELSCLFQLQLKSEWVNETGYYVPAIRTTVTHLELLKILRISYKSMQKQWFYLLISKQH